MDFLSQLWMDLGSDNFTTHGLVIVANLLLLIFARQLIAPFNEGKDVAARVGILRALSMLFIALHIADFFLVSTFPVYQHYFIKLGYSFAAVYVTLFLFQMVSFLSRRKFGETKSIDGKTLYLDTYNSRLVDLISLVFIILCAIYMMVQIWDLEGLLQTTGLLGIIFAFMALTNNIWAPDIYYGLVILNSHMLEDGDIIKVQGSQDEYIIHKVSFVYTILLDVRNNHRVMMRNSRLIEGRIDNLSKRASLDGLRYSIRFNVSYPKHVLVEDIEQRKKAFHSFANRVKDMFELANEKILENQDAKINKKLPFEFSIADSGDYALAYDLFFYLEMVPNTKVTKTARNYLVKTPQLIQEAVNEAALIYGVELATPALINFVDLEGAQASLQKNKTAVEELSFNKDPSVS